MSGNAEGAPALALASKPAGEIAVVEVHGILDATTREQFASYLADTAAQYGQGMILDLGGVSFMDSRALGLIVHHWQASTAANARFALVGVQYSKSKVMWVTGLAGRLPLYDTLDDALAAMREA
ncbi:STAS domain-containing protein [Spongiactinospora sp. TRM90649]|uniref:STAS domain-containing protein n=1 Tax=Spongiactinospora sp. TRM90649 TaxID=3031114 RepID=UPI0023F6DBB8|nr:STAS domain-containing protein [Spongiactinospora sp. TRM90649]MDF5755865.1 STAS domain-containing protein [Spongiactinospora sp. TRM90649]